MPWELAPSLDLDPDLSAAEAGHLPTPGKVTLTQRLAPRRAARATPATDLALVQADGGAVAVDDPFALHLVARRGVAGGGMPLPHLDRLQGAFGHHDLGGVRAHVGGQAAEAASALGAQAYATGDEVAFAAAPDLRQAAHEAAHVVQQRGGVRLDGGVGHAGDVYERHADEVAARVVRGESAEELLDTMAHRGAVGGPAVQRLDAGDVTGNVVGLTSTDSSGRLDARSRRRLWERLAELGFADAARVDDFTDAELRAAVVQFQTSEEGARALASLRDGNDETASDGSAVYEDSEAGPDATGRVPTVARPGFTVGAVRANDLTAQALANSWPQTVFGRSMTEAQCYQALSAIVQARSLTFDAARVNVIGLRGYQGGGIHDNDAELIYTSENVYNDTLFIAWTNETGGQFAYQARGTVDPGGPAAEPAPDDDHRFMVAPDQAWTYRGYSHGRSAKFDRAEYDPVDPMDVERGRLYDEHPDLLAAALEAPDSGGGRVIYRAARGGRDQGAGASGPRSVETDRTADGRPRLVSALHSGASGSAHGDRVFGDSVGCSVVHGRWFPGFNESLRRAARESGGSEGRVEFTYSLIDPSLFAAAELERILDPIAPRRAGGGPSAAATEGAPGSTADSSEEGSGGVVDGDGGVDGEAGAVHAAAAAGVAGSGQVLPHLDVIQRSFGHHDVRAVQAHVGGAAADAADVIGARAYATGDRVAFAGAPDLRQAAHEAAHVVQQRGGVRLDGGVGRAGDVYERHADEVAARVVRGESAEALLDTMAHRGLAGGPAVQREAEDRPHLAAAVAAVHEATELDTAIEALSALHPGRADRDREYTVHLGAGEHVVAGRDVGYLLGQARRRRRSLGSGEWSGRGTPREGHTLCGQRIDGDRQVTVEGVTLRLVQHSGRWGVMYGSNYDAFRAAGERAATAYEAAHQPYRAAAARGATVMHEGGVAAINTYDGMVFTLGPGYAGGRLAHALAPLRDTPAGAALAAVTGHHDVAYLGGLTFNGDARVRLDVVALARMVNVIERYPIDFAEAWIRDVVERDGLAGGGERAGDAAATQTIPEVVGVAEYLHHGYGDYAGTPTSRVAAAVAAHPGNPSAQVAHVLRAYAERAARDRTERPDVYRARIESIATLRLPHKVTDFIEAARGRDPSFRFDLAAAQAVIPCLTTHAPFTSTTTEPGGLYLDCEVDGVHRYWDYGR